ISLHPVRRPDLRTRFRQSTLKRIRRGMMRLRLVGLAAFIAALSLSVPVTLGAFLSGQWPQDVPAPDEVVRTLLPRLGEAGRAVKSRLVPGLGSAAAPVTIGSQAPGAF